MTWGSPILFLAPTWVSLPSLEGLGIVLPNGDTVDYGTYVNTINASVTPYPHVWHDQTLAEPDGLAPDTDGELFDVELEIEPGTAQAVGAWVRGLDLACDLREGSLSFLGRSAPLPRGADGRVRLRFLVDRTSLEVFAGDGQVSMSFCLLPEAADQPLVFYARDGQAQVLSLTVHELRSVWC